jgi:hypothetical protein
MLQSADFQLREMAAFALGRLAQVKFLIMSPVVLDSANPTAYVCQLVLLYAF